MEGRKEINFSGEVFHLESCQKCGSRNPSSRIFRVSDERRVCDACYMDLTEGNQTGWHPNQPNLSVRR